MGRRLAAAAIYARISQDATGEHLGVDRQERPCRALAAGRWLTISDVLVDNDVERIRPRKRASGVWCTESPAPRPGPDAHDRDPVARLPEGVRRPRGP